MINYQNQIKKIDFMKLNYKQLKQKDYNNQKWQKNLGYKRKKIKKEQNQLTLSIEKMKHLRIKKLKV